MKSYLNQIYIFLQMTTTKKTLKDTNYFSEGSFKKNFVDRMLQEGIPTLIARTLLAPLQRYRIIRQTQIIYPIRTRKFTGIMDYLIKTPSQQGISAFWRGNGAHFYLYFWQLVIKLGIYDNLKQQCQIYKEQMQEMGYIEPKLIDFALLPFLTSFITLVFTYPFDTLRVRLAMNYHKHSKNAYFTTVRGAFSDFANNQEKRLNVYRGFWIANLISFAHFNLFRTTINLTNQIISSRSTQMENNQTPMQILSQFYDKQWLISIGLMTILYPLDTIKKLLQLNNMSRPILASNARSLLKYLNTKNTPLFQNLFNGISVSIFRNILLAPTYVGATMAFQKGKSAYNSNKN